MRSIKALWIVLAVIVVVSFAGLGLIGRQIYLNMPPIPDTVMSQSGDILFTRDDIETGRSVWQSMGGHELGSIWGHGAYLTPDWSADLLHRELLFLLDRWAMRDYGSRYEDISSERQAALRDRLQTQLRPNRVNEQTGRLVVSDARARISATTRDCSAGHRNSTTYAHSTRCRPIRSPTRHAGMR